MFTGRAAIVSAVLLLTGCGYGASRTAHEAQISMIGMTSNDLQACAGVPDKTTKLNQTTSIYSYDYKPGGSGGVNVTLPLDLGGVSVGTGGSYCRATFRLVNSRVTELHYTGDDDPTIGSDGVCAPVIRGCLRQPEPSMQQASRTVRERSSAYSTPPVPPQPPEAEKASP